MTTYKDINQISFDNGDTIYNFQDARYVIDSSLNSTSINPVQNKVVYSAIQDVETRNGGYTVTSPALVQTDGTLTWVITHNLNTTNLLVTLYNSSGNEMVKNVNITSANSVTLTFSSNTNASAGDYRAVIFTTKVITVDSELFNNRANVDLSNISNAGKVNIASISLPSNSVYKSITAGASGTNYTAPADGWYLVAAQSSSASSYLASNVTGTGVTNKVYLVTSGAPSGYQMVLLVPAIKGVVYNFGYGNVTNFRVGFHYTNGSESEYTP